MARLALSVFAVVVAMIAVAVPAQGADSAPIPPGDSVVGGGHVFDPSFGEVSFLQISIDAQSDALGGNPTGSVSFVIFFPDTRQFLPVGGQVACLNVNRNNAVIGFDDLGGLGRVTVFVSDNGPLGATDGFIAARGFTDCSPQPGIILPRPLFGGVAVQDAPSKDQCKHGGWRNYTDAFRQPFTDQGDCIAFALGVT
jgi:hypothetical protein